MDLNSISREVERQLANDEIGWEDALDKLQPIIKGNKSWHTKEWREARELIIKNACEQCGSTKQPMVLQHFIHPMSFGQIFRELCGKDAWVNFKKEYDYILGKDLLIDRSTCPACGSTNIHQLKTQEWSCYKCHTKHDTPVIKPAFNKESFKVLSKRRKDKELQNQRWRAFQQQYGDLVGKQAVLEFINQSRIYLSFENTATFCKKCAFAWDKKGLRLCQQCKKNWHFIYSQQCRECKK